VREYAYELLGDAVELDGARDRHLVHYSKLAAAADPGPDAWPSPSAERLIDELAGDYENVRAALEWGAASDPCAARSSFFATRDLFLLLAQSDGRRLAEQLLERCPSRDRGRAETQITAGLLAMMTVDIEAARRVLPEARELADELGEEALGGWAMFFFGLTETLGGEFDSAQPHLEECRALHHRLGVRVGEGVASAALGLGAAMKGDTDGGQELLEAALSIQVAEGYHWGQGQAHLYLAIIAEATGSPERVTEHSRAAVESLRRYRDSSLLSVALICQASTLVRGDPARALRIVAAATAIRARIGGGFPPVFRELAERVRAEARAAVGPEAERVSSAASRLGADDAIALAFGTGKGPSTPDSGGLSARELEVAALVADGLANKEIAARLHLSVRTIESHVRHALAKLALDNRTQLATWAQEHSLASQ
jgi:DNA-binding NarL/FixJ family response regulator